MIFGNVHKKLKWKNLSEIGKMKMTSKYLGKKLKIIFSNKFSSFCKMEIIFLSK